MNRSVLHISHQVWGILALAIVLVLGRVVFAGSGYFLYLLWNLALALLPFVVSSVLLWYVLKGKAHPWVLIVGGIVWLLLFPNAPYIVTDVIHLKESHAAPLWYDALMLYTSAWAGMILALHSLGQIETIIRRYLSEKLTWISLAALVFISSFGIYLGRYLRWNSWDVIANPHNLSSDIWNIFANPQTHQDGFLITIVFFVFISVSYFAWRIPGRECGSSGVVE